MIFILAFRNLLRNRRNTLIVFLLILLITCLFFLGNTLLTVSQRGLMRTYSENYTGDVAIMADSGYSLSVFGVNTPAIGDFFSVPALENYQEITERLKTLPEVAGYTSQVSGIAAMDVLGRRYQVPLFGVDAASYFTLFSGIKLTKGRFLASGEQGVMLTAERAKRIEKETEKKLRIGDKIVFSTVGRTGFKIREAPLVGIFVYQSSGPVMEEIVLTDPQTVRSLNSLMVASGNDVQLREDEVDLLTDDWDSLFDESQPVAASGEGVSLEELRNRVSRSGAEDGEAEEGGSWNFILLRLCPGVSHRAVIGKINEFVRSSRAQAVDWRTAAGTPALIVLLLQVLFNGGFLLLAVAGILAIINIFLIVVFRRTREIGTLMALGASQGYIRSLILTENLSLSFAAGMCGILLGSLVLRFINTFSIRVANPLMASLFGQTVLRVPFSWPVAWICLFCAVLLGFFSSMYPVRVALRIEPAVAVSKG